MTKEMTGKEKLLFIASFMWAMHWGVRVAFAAISTFELRFFYCFTLLTLVTTIVEEGVKALLLGSWISTSLTIRSS